ncbi:MAG: WD repeat-containing protein jip5 [Chaenotheca gracillima]|nr:MAG: WD repeat-containing protein jip5 [Chaenotheca gracillima]
MYDCICTLPLTSELFAQAIHPTEPLVAVGLSAGHVQTFRLPPVPEKGGIRNGSFIKQGEAENGFGKIDTVWRTRRHKGSCRSLAYSHDGEALYSGGTDAIVKAASSQTGQVTSKIAIPLDPSTDQLDLPTLIHALSPQTLLLTTDSSALYLYDLRNSNISSRPQQTHHPHDDYVSSLSPIPASATSTSGFPKQWITTGGSTLAVTDLRHGVLVRSEDQEEELLSSAFVDGGFPAKKGRTGQKAVVGGAGGVITLWEKGVWDDQDERIVVDRGEGGPKSASGAGAGGGESLDVITLLPEGVGGAPGRKSLGVGMGDGRIKIVGLGANKVIGELRHDDVEGVVGLGVEADGRLISGGGEIVKVWRETVEEEGEEDEGDEADATELKRDHDGTESEDADSGADSDKDSSEEEKADRRKKKKRKKGRGKERSADHTVLGFNID